MLERKGSVKEKKIEICGKIMMRRRLLNESRRDNLVNKNEFLGKVSTFSRAGRKSPWTDSEEKECVRKEEEVTEASSQQVAFSLLI